MTDVPDLKSNLLEEHLVQQIHHTYNNALTKWLRDHAAAFEELKGVKDTDPYFEQKRLKIIEKYGLIRSLALVLVRAGHASIPLVMQTMTRIEAINGEAEKLGVSSE